MYQSYQPYQPMLSEFAQTIHTPSEHPSVSKTSDNLDQEVTHLAPSPSPSKQPPTAPLVTTVTFPDISYPESEPVHILVALLHANDVPHEVGRISGNYKRLFEKLFRAAIDAYDVYVTFELQAFDMSRGEFPALEEINKFYGLMVVGAATRTPGSNSSSIASARPSLSMRGNGGTRTLSDLGSGTT
ncbi:hypothetical protein BC937DRAFT_93969 [Endogone sp. FLAS-F59071]|nr:hypothetical protein BC937DRAFT_93969 [Endogone sp. FLAS-F59071]|eukprot:RUS20949.1 hypothetical protein BC937DRAFT_93969 [Endogone sp. FLAS-F59071]